MCHHRLHSRYRNKSFTTDCPLTGFVPPERFWRRLEWPSSGGWSCLKQSTVAWQPSLVAKVFFCTPSMCSGNLFSYGGTSESLQPHLFGTDSSPAATQLLFFCFFPLCTWRWLESNGTSSCQRQGLNPSPTSCFQTDFSTKLLKGEEWERDKIATKTALGESY